MEKSTKWYAGCGTRRDTRSCTRVRTPESSRGLNLPNWARVKDWTSCVLGTKEIGRRSAIGARVLVGSSTVALLLNSAVCGGVFVFSQRRGYWIRPCFSLEAALDVIHDMLGHGKFQASTRASRARLDGSPNACSRPPGALLVWSHNVANSLSSDSRCCRTTPSGSGKEGLQGSSRQSALLLPRSRRVLTDSVHITGGTSDEAVYAVLPRRSSTVSSQPLAALARILGAREGLLTSSHLFTTLRNRLVPGLAFGRASYTAQVCVVEQMVVFVVQVDLAWDTFVIVVRLCLQRLTLTELVAVLDADPNTSQLRK